MSENKLVQLLNQYEHEHVVLETGKTINIKSITTGQMKSILQYEGNDDPSIIDMVLDDIIMNCVSSPGFQIDDLTLQDRFEVLIGIRKITKGDTYTFNIKCPKCKTESIQGIDLTELELIGYPADINKKVVINHNLTISLDFIRRSHQKESVRYVDKIPNLTENQKTTEIATAMYAYGMVGFETKNGILSDISFEDKIEFLDSLDEKAYGIINDWYEKYNYGTKFKYTVKCKSCEFTKEEDIPLAGFFF